MSSSPKLQVNVRVRILMNWFFSLVFLGFILFTQRPLFTRLVHMHVTPAGGACGALRLVDGRHNNVGVSLRERRDITQVMLGVSLRARWDATLVIIITKYH